MVEEDDDEQEEEEDEDEEQSQCFFLHFLHIGSILERVSKKIT